MSGEDSKEPDPSKPRAEKSGAADVKTEGAELLRKAGSALVPIFVTAGSLLGFVAFAGAVIVWTRFFALHVPPDQAVKAVPRSELVATGSSLLLLFGFFGALAVLATFLVDPGGRATPGMSRTLLGLATVEAAIGIVIGVPDSSKLLACGLLVALFVAALAVTFMRRLTKLKDVNRARPDEELAPIRDYGFFLDIQGEFRVPPTQLLATGGMLVLAFALAVVPTALDLSTLVQVAGFVAALALAKPVRNRVRRDASMIGESVGESMVVGAGTEKTLRRRERRKLKQIDEAEEERERLWRHRPSRLVPNLWGSLSIGLMVLIGAGFPLIALHEWWLAVSWGSAAMLGYGLWRIAVLSKRGFMWFGLAVFLSVPLFGTLTLMARNVEHPQVQPMALIRNTDGPDEAIQGLYVTEAEDRVYFATVATEGCSNELTPHSGRLEWVPKSEVVAMSIGPLQSVEDAGSRALEMAYSLTPAVETGNGVEATLGIGGKGAPEAKPPASPALDKRLEHTGPAVRPDFGSGLSLTPDNASPDGEVTLRMSAPNPNDEVLGFGRTRNGHALRVGGVRANIVKEPARNTESAEYLRVVRGPLLTLAKGEPYARKPSGEYVSVPEAGSGFGRRRFLKLTDRSVLEVRDREMTAAGIYLELEPGTELEPPRLAPGWRQAKLRAPGRAGALGEVEPARLEPQPLGQAWHEREITFVVPKNASTGAVTVECSQLAGQPLLQVANAPEARISVRIEPGSERVAFDSRRSTDVEDEELSRRWDVGGLRRGNQPQMSADLPPRFGAYAVKLAVTDESGRSGSTEIHLLRTPASLFPFDESELRDPRPLDRARQTLMQALEKELPVAIEIDGHADDPGTVRKNARLSLERARYVRRLLRPTDPVAGVGPDATIPVRTLAYGEGCPVDSRPGRRPRNRRVDVFVLDPGVSIAPPAGCHARHFESNEWSLPTCTDGQSPQDEPKAGRGFPGQLRKLVWGVLLGYLAGNPAAKQSCDS